MPLRFTASPDYHTDLIEDRGIATIKVFDPAVRQEVVDLLNAGTATFAPPPHPTKSTLDEIKRRITVLIGMEKANPLNSGSEVSESRGTLRAYTHAIDIVDDFIRSPVPNTYNIGDETMKRVFEPAGLTNVSDWQAVLDAVEAALKKTPDVIGGLQVSLNDMGDIIRRLQAYGMIEPDRVEPVHDRTRRLPWVWRQAFRKV